MTFRPLTESSLRNLSVAASPLAGTCDLRASSSSLERCLTRGHVEWGIPPATRGRIRRYLGILCWGGGDIYARCVNAANRTASPRWSRCRCQRANDVVASPDWSMVIIQGPFGRHHEPILSVNDRRHSPRLSLVVLRHLLQNSIYQ